MKRAVLSLLLIFPLVVAASGRITGSWNGKLVMGGQSLTIVFNINGDSCTLDSPDQAAMGIPVELKRCTADSLIVESPQMRAVYEGQLKDGIISGTFKQMGYSFPLDLKPGVPVYYRPQTPIPPFDYRTEEVTFVNPIDSAVLSGTLSYPVKFIPGRTPVVLLVSGSGLQNRDEELFQHRPFALIAHHLAMNGIASLRYDDRSVGKSTGSASEATTATFATDAEAGLKYLKETCRFGKAGVLGHSEGGQIAFILGGKGKTDFVVSMAGTAVRGDRILVEQNRIILLEKGVPESMTEDYCRALEKVYGYKLAYGSMPGMSPELLVTMAITEAKADLPEGFRRNLEGLMKSQNAWLNHFIAYDPAMDIKNITCPVMAINGEKDCQVVAETNLDALRELLKVKQGDVIKSYPGLNHLFQHCTTGSVGEYIKITETLSPEVLEDIVEFINGSL